MEAGPGYACLAMTKRQEAMGRSRKPIQEKLREGVARLRARAAEDRRRFHLAMDSSADMIALVDRATMKFVDVNSTMCRLLGYTREELLAKHIEEFLPVSRGELEAAYDRQIADPAVPGGMHSYYLCKDGSHLPFESKRQVLRSGDKWLISVVSRDIRERIQAESALRESEARFRSLTELSSDFYWETDASHRVSNAIHGSKHNPVTAPGSQFGKTRWDIPSLSPDAAGWAAHRAVLDAHLPFRGFEFSRLDTTGAIRTLSISGEPMFDDSGAFKGYRGIGQDITARKRTEEELRASRRLLEIVIDAIPMSIFAKDTNSNYVMVNKYAAEFFETSKQAMVMRHTSRLPTHEATRTQSLEDDQWVYQNRRTLTHETFIQRPDGTPVPFHSSKIPLFDDGGALIGLLGINRDVSEERRAQEALRESEQRFRAVFERSKAGIATWGLDGLFLTVNSAFCEFVGYAADELVGKMSAGNLRQPGEDEGLNLTGRMRRGELSHITRDRRYRRRDASTVWGRTTIAAVTGNDRVPQYFIAVVIDITEARESRERIERFNVELEERVEERTAELRDVIKELDAFTYSVSHDLRAPVGAVSGFAHLLRTSESLHLSDDGKHLLSVIEQNAERMVNLIEGLLRFARLGRAKIQRLPLSMDALARDALRELADATRAEVQIGNLPECEGDPVLLQQVWANIIGNALKYSKTRNPPRIEVGWDQGKQAYFVRDNGVGFDMQYADKLFGAFERLHAEAEFEGSGIGLAIVHRIIERHGGTIWAEAAVDRGATFWFTVPAAPPNVPPR
jgi:PAS domain S-box-containing protein